jgi:dTDP-4-amino-4,6-dideoxygalactose transaminase
LLNAYRWLSAKNLVLGSSATEEIDTRRMPAGFRKAMAPIQAGRGLAALARLDALQAARRENAHRLSRFLAAHGKNRVKEAFFPDHGFCKYPLLVTRRTAFREAARACRVRLGDWFCSPLHPVEHGLDRWGLDPASCPHAVHAAEHVVNLPVGPGDLRRLIPFLAGHLDQIVDDGSGSEPC